MRTTKKNAGESSAAGSVGVAEIAEIADVERRAEAFRTDARRIEAEVAKSVVGQREVIRNLTVAAIAGGHSLLEGAPGLGKTALALAFAKAVGGKFSRFQGTPDATPADLTGTNVLTESPDGSRRFEFWPGPIFANVFLFDELNRATPKTQSALLEATQERAVTVGGETRRLDDFFFVVATQNPFDAEGTNPLPEAQLDRFFNASVVPYPTDAELTEILRRTTTNADPGADVETVVSPARLVEMRRFAREILISEELLNIVVELVEASRPEDARAPEIVRRFVRRGASPRGAQAVLAAAKVVAAFDGRLCVARDDLRAVAKSALRRRLILNFEGRADGVSTDRVVDELVAAFVDRR